MKICILSASTRESRLSHRVSLALEKALKPFAEVELIDLKEVNMPQLDLLLHEQNAPTPEHTRYRQHMQMADALIFVSPEYNGAYSSALKNAVDHLTKTEFSRKALGICAVSSGSMGGMRAALAMQHLALALWAIPSPTMFLVPNASSNFDEEGNLLNENLQAGMDKFIADFVWLAHALNKAK